MTRFECVDARKAEGFAVTAACEVAKVSTSGYYDLLVPRNHRRQLPSVWGRLVAMAGRGCVIVGALTAVRP